MSFEGSNYYGHHRIEKIAQYLSSCYTESMVNFSNDFDEFDIQINDIYRQNYSGERADLWLDYTNSFDITDVKNAINELSPRKDCGPMGISTQYLQYNIDIVAPLLKNIFNSILTSGRIPQEWKQSFLIPIPKKGSSSDIANYRGISIQSIVPKILDKLLTKKLLHHIASIIPDSQHGFVKARSTTSNLMHAIQFIQQHIYRGNQVDAIYFDLSKAFDRVDHFLMAKKIAELDAPLTFLRTLIAFITNRSSIIKIDGRTHNISFTTKSSVPQGSCCGPVLFLIYCFDIPLCVNNTNVLLLSFADDTKFLGLCATRRRPQAASIMH